MKKKVCDKSEEKISNQILKYLMEFKDSRDSVEGITEWWVMEQEIVEQVGKVKKAIEELVSKKFLVKYVGKDSTESYQINKNKYKEIEKFLKE